MHTALITIEIIIGSLLSILILIQHRASGLSAAFGGTGTTYVQRRGAEKALFRFTIGCAFAFTGIAAAMMYLG